MINDINIWNKILKGNKYIILKILYGNRDLTMTDLHKKTSLSLSLINYHLYGHNKKLGLYDLSLIYKTYNRYNITSKGKRIISSLIRRNEVKK